MAKYVYGEVYTNGVLIEAYYIRVDEIYLRQLEYLEYMPPEFVPGEDDEIVPN